ncbi:hypothetical protein PLESTB_001309500 [Pleodorina starrii]|uniref:Uncharacterized protein n=1 Tax=Pleodorina starrii TaxID=330485 RepID=A0A9W6BTP0_9CHLO|nr:hypothetical protein PLESTM_001022100 [Pleodorina starrii]GLC58022.1 hypothetical protein PLESTB_001309500 [Pleodorina starrii]GLC69587.1 hypothetical protein PLESTF_000851600 [Pleodorina starrii]
MDLRHGFCQTWRRTSPAPPSVRTCTPASAVIPVQRRITPQRGAARQCLSASCAVAIDSTFETSTLSAEPALFEVHESQGFCTPDASCPAVLQTRLSKAHSSAASAALVVQDTPDERLVATASLDKGMAIWRFYSSQGEGENTEGSVDESIEVTRLKVPGAPVFSLAKIPEVLPDGTIVRKRPKPPGIYLGTSSQEVLTWMLGSKDVTDKVVLDGHTGWVRSLAVTGKWLFSCGCNYLRLWDTTFRTPKECDSVRLFTGDILAIAASDGRVFTVGADGSLHSWNITRAGDLQAGPSQDKAHEGRVSACTISGGRVFTVSYDGSVKAWDVDTLELVAEVKGAHNGEKIFCAAFGANGVLFTGGDDKLIRAWDQDLNPIGAPLEGHGAAVRVLSAGRRALLVSGDADGDVCIWETYPVDLTSSSRAVAASTMEASPFALDGAVTLADGVPVASGAVEVAMGEAAMQQLETMLAVPQPELPQQEAVSGTADCDTFSAAAAYDPASAAAAAYDPASAAAAAYDTASAAAAAYDPATALPAADWQAPTAVEEQPQLEAAAHASLQTAAADLVTIPAEPQQDDGHYYSPVPEQDASQAAAELQEACVHEQVGFPGAVEEWQQDDAAPGAAAAGAGGLVVCAEEHHQHQQQQQAQSGGGVVGGPSADPIVEDPVEPSQDGAGRHAACDAEEVAAAAPMVNANGSGGFAVLAATVSEEKPECCHTAAAAAAEAAEAAEEEGESDYCQIEVESVASAVAAACLAKDLEGRVSAGVGASGRSHR